MRAQTFRSVVALSLMTAVALPAMAEVRPASEPFRVNRTDDFKQMNPVAAFSGTWEGAWDNALPSRLIVEKIDTESARVVFAWADHPQGRFQAGWSRVQATPTGMKRLLGGRTASAQPGRSSGVSATA